MDQLGHTYTVFQEMNFDLYSNHDKGIIVPSIINKGVYSAKAQYSILGVCTEISKALGSGQPVVKLYTLVRFKTL